jgi:hypothetical protein
MSSFMEILNQVNPNSDDSDEVWEAKMDRIIAMFYNGSPDGK